MMTIYDSGWVDAYSHLSTNRTDNIFLTFFMYMWREIGIPEFRGVFRGTTINCSHWNSDRRTVDATCQMLDIDHSDVINFLTVNTTVNVGPNFVMFVLWKNSSISHSRIVVRSENADAEFYLSLNCDLSTPRT